MRPVPISTSAKHIHSIGGSAGRTRSLYAPSNLYVRGAGAHVASVTHDFRFQHEFPRDWQCSGHPVVLDWANAVAQPRERHRALLQRLLTLDTPGRQILFVRTCEASGDTEAMEDLLAALDARFAQADWQLLVINPTTPLYDPRIVTASFLLADLEWTGFASEPWTRAFAALGLRMKPGAKRFAREMRAEIDV
jgi:hypothetical protein